MVAHVLLAGVDPRLVVPAGQPPSRQRGGHQASAALAVEYGAGDRGDVPASPGLVEERLERSAVGRTGGEVLALLRVVAQVVEQAGVLLGVD